MATSSQFGTLAFGNATAAAIQGWAGKIESLLTAAGWVQTSDTGQTAASALAVPTTPYQAMGYQVWRMADSLQSTTPVFVKMEFGSSNTAANPSMWFTLGTGSDGAGGLTGVFATRSQTPNFANTATASFVGSGAPNRLCFFIGLGPHVLFSLERTHDGAGADTSDGVLLLLDMSGSSSGTIQYFKLVRFSGSTPPNSTYIGAFCPSGTTWALGANIGVCPVRFFDGQPTNPSLNQVVYMHADLSALNTVAVSLYGTNRTYMTLGTTLYNPGSLPAGGSASMMLRYE